MSSVGLVLHEDGALHVVAQAGEPARTGEQLVALAEAAITAGQLTMADEGEGVGLHACVPIVAGDELLGAFSVEDREPRPDLSQLTRAMAGMAQQLAYTLQMRERLLRSDRLERELIDVRGRLEVLGDVACDGVWDLDVSTGLLELSTRTCELLGLPASGGLLAYQQMVALVHPSERRELRRMAMRQLRGEATSELEVRCRRASASWHWFRVRVRSKTLAGGHRCLLGSLQDVHDKRRSQEHLSRVSRMLGESQALARVGGWELDLATKHLFWTAETYRIHETSPDTYTPTVESSIAFYVPEARDRIREVIAIAINRGRAFSVDLPIVTARGRHVWCRVTGGTVFSNGQAVRLLGAIQDITEQRRLDEDLIKAKNAAEAASESKSAFLAAMSHEIRTPMHTVLGYTDMLRDSHLDDEQRECVDIISSSGNSLLRLIDDILDFSKVEAGKMQLERAAVDLQAVAGEVARMLQPQASQKGLAVIASAGGMCDCLALADPQRTRQVLVNLAGNAVKFTDSGRVTLTVFCRKGDVHVEVRDTGIGIPADQLDRLFDDFVQVDSSAQRRFGGTGLGLAISKQLVEAMGGSIGVRSELGVGSTFWFSLPQTRQQEVVGDEQGPSSVGDSNTDERAGVHRVLLAEDNRLNQRLAVRVLETFGYRVETANDGVAAVEMATSFEYDLVLMDCLMPEMDGFEATRRIRESEALGDRHVPIIALTANALPEDRAACLASGMDDFVSKPFTKQALRTATERWLNANANS